MHEECNLVIFLHSPCLYGDGAVRVLPPNKFRFERPSEFRFQRKRTCHSERSSVTRDKGHDSVLGNISNMNNSMEEPRLYDRVFLWFPKKKKKKHEENAPISLNMIQVSKTSPNFTSYWQISTFSGFIRRLKIKNHLYYILHCDDFNTTYFVDIFIRLGSLTLTWQGQG